MISAPGIGSGLDVSSIISQLMAIERQPLNDLKKRADEYQAQISSYGKLKSSLSELQDSLAVLRSQTNFNGRTAASSDDSIFSATASSTANLGSYSIEVLQKASNHKLASTGFTDADTVVGQGSLTISTGAGSFNVTVDGTNETLAGIRDAINAAVGNDIVSASIVNVDDGFGGTEAKLVLTAKEGGAANAIDVSVTDSDTTHTDMSGLSQLSYTTGGLNLNQVADARDAQIKIDTMTVSSTNNVFDGNIPGVTLNILNANPGVQHTLNVDYDQEKTKENINSFIDTFNKIQSSLDGLQKGDLSRDSTLRTLERRLYNEIQTSALGNGGTYNYLSDIGISLQKDGTLKLEDPATLDSALSVDPDSVASLFNANGAGFAQRLDSLLDGYLAVDGIIKDRTDGIDARIDSIDRRMDNLEYRLGRTQARYQAQFSALDALIGQMDSTSGFLNNQLSLLQNSKF